MKLNIESILRLMVTLYGVFPILGLPVWVSWLELDGELPPQIASHWNFSGQPDGFMAPSDFAITMSIVFAVFWLLAVWLLWTKRLPHLTRWVIVVPILVIYVGMLNLVVESILAQRGLADASAAQLPLGSVLFLFISLPLILAFTLSMPKVTISDHRIEASIWAIPIYRVQLDEVSSVEEVQLRARDYGGLGLRFGRHGFAIIPRPGLGVKITNRDGESVAIRCRNALEIVKKAAPKENQ